MPVFRGQLGQHLQVEGSGSVAGSGSPRGANAGPRRPPAAAVTNTDRGRGSGGRPAAAAPLGQGSRLSTVAAPGPTWHCPAATQQGRPALTYPVTVTSAAPATRTRSDLGLGGAWLPQRGSTPACLSLGLPCPRLPEPSHGAQSRVSRPHRPSLLSARRKEATEEWWQET